MSNPFAHFAFGGGGGGGGDAAPSGGGGSSRKRPAPAAAAPIPPQPAAAAAAAAGASGDAAPSGGGGNAAPSRDAAPSGGGGGSGSEASPHRPLQAGGLPEKLGGQCDGSAQRPLRLIFVGHNPSQAAWEAGHYYANPSNRFWPLLSATGIAPGATPASDDLLPARLGISFTDVLAGRPGTDSSRFTSQDFAAARGGFYARLRAHVDAAAAAVGCGCEGRACAAPSLVAFTGKRQYVELLQVDAAGRPRRGRDRVDGASVALGRQPPGALPPGWPLPAAPADGGGGGRGTEVWVLTSTSGAAPMTNAQREAPYRALAARLAEIEWPRAVSCPRPRQLQPQPRPPLQPQQPSSPSARQDEGQAEPPAAAGGGVHGNPPSAGGDDESAAAKKAPARRRGSTTGGDVYGDDGRSARDAG